VNQRIQETQVEKVIKRKFTCEVCKQEYSTDTAINDLQKEFKDNFGHTIEECDDEIASVCDGCYEEMKPFIDEMAELLVEDYLKPNNPEKP